MGSSSGLKCADSSSCCFNIFVNEAASVAEQNSVCQTGAAAASCGGEFGGIGCAFGVGLNPFGAGTPCSI